MTSANGSSGEKPPHVRVPGGGAPFSETPPRVFRRRRLAALAVALALVGGAAWAVFGGQRGAVFGPDSAVDIAFRGCDDAGACGAFRLVAPGADYRWDYGSDRLQQGDGGRPSLRDVLREPLSEARLVVAAGLASNEGGETFNRRLAACRSRRLAALVADAQFDLRTTAPAYRLTLGRYAPDPSAASLDAAIERLVVVIFMRRANPDMALDQALKNGLADALARGLPDAPAPIARQLDLPRYSCWANEFAATPAGAPRDACFDEPADPQELEALCAVF